MINGPSDRGRVAKAARIAARFLSADLHPQLGKPGGPCQVVNRIRQEVTNPRLQDQMIDEIMQGKSLTNPEASQIYDMDREMGNKLIKRIELGPHAQYRMDLRSITIDDLKEALRLFAKRYFEHPDIAPGLLYGDETSWLAPDKLFVVFALHNGVAKIITTYWQGKADPRPPTSCPV